MHMTTETIRANGLSFSCLTAGKGKLALCVHGFPDTPHGFRDVIARLAGAGYRVVAPFTRGIGPSEAPSDDDYSARALGRDVLAWISALGEERATVIGHDWGAVAAYAAAALEPSRIERLVTIAIPPLRVVRPVPAWLAMVAFFQLTPVAVPALRAQDGALVDRIYRAASPTWRFDPGDTAPFKAVIRERDGARGALGTYRSFVRQLVKGGAESRRFLLEKVRVPSLVVVGPEDPTVSSAVIAEIPTAAAAPMKVGVIEGAGHFPHREKPDAFARHLFDFLAT
jgi:pimeloyl-ACP methyl ester carboxylesterase